MAFGRLGEQAQRCPTLSVKNLVWVSATVRLGLDDVIYFPLLNDCNQSVPALQRASSTNSFLAGSGGRRWFRKPDTHSIPTKRPSGYGRLRSPNSNFRHLAAAGALTSKTAGFQPVFAHSQFYLPLTAPLSQLC